MGAVEFYAVVAGFVEELGGVSEAFNNVLDFFRGCGMWFLECHAHDGAFKLDITCGNRVLLDPRLDLSPWMTHLGYNEATVFLALCSEGLESIKAFPAEVASAGNDEIAGGFELVVLHHGVSG